jgi:hypothetical protein
MLSLVAFLLPAMLTAAAQSEPAGNKSTLAAEEKETCSANLKSIFQAVQAYQADHKDLPNWLSDLVPQYLADGNVLVCPVCRRTGQIESPPLADPKISSSYLFEFCPVPLGQAAPDAPARTRRDWKRRQMGLLGSAVPIVRCRHHNPVLNLAFDGHIYESPGSWELAFTNRVAAEELTAARLFAGEPAQGDGAQKKPPLVRQYPPRDVNAAKTMLDLTSFYNAMLGESWHGGTGNDLAALPVGLQSFEDIQFDIRGIVQLGSKSAAASRFPPQVTSIRVRQKCRHLHFLHSAGFGNLGDENTQIGSYVVHFATNQMRLEIPIIYGRNVRNWHVLSKESKSEPELSVAWTGENAVSKKSRNRIRLFLTTWTNLVPDIEIESIDFVSAMAAPAPFLIAISAD